MKNTIYGVRIIEGVEFIKKVLDDECIVSEYVTHAESVHHGHNYITATGIPVIYIQQAGVTGYYLYLDTLDEDFNRVEGFMIRFNTSIEQPLKALEVFNKLFLQHERERII